VSQTVLPRSGIIRREHRANVSIPVEDLASNGESMRGKVFHIACALFAQGSTVDEQGQELIKDWCNMVCLFASALASTCATWSAASGPKRGQKDGKGRKEQGQEEEKSKCEKVG
jgi:hypothetical protein